MRETPLWTPSAAVSSYPNCAGHSPTPGRPPYRGRNPAEMGRAGGLVNIAAQMVNAGFAMTTETAAWPVDSEDKSGGPETSVTPRHWNAWMREDEGESDMARKSARLPKRFPVGSTYVVEARGSLQGMMLMHRYIRFPDGRRVELAARLVQGCKGHSAAKGKSRRRSDVRPGAQLETAAAR
jgi:hypothetical protein